MHKFDFPFVSHLIVNGGWTKWGQYSACRQTGKWGQKTRTRSCTNPSPKYKGKKCDGSGTETKNCNGKNLKITTCIYNLFHTFISHSISYTYS